MVPLILYVGGQVFLLVLGFFLTVKPKPNIQTLVIAVANVGFSCHLPTSEGILILRLGSARSHK